MKYLADSIVEYVIQQCSGAGTFRFVLPSYPARLLLMLGSQLEERLARIPGRRVRLLYGVAYRLGQAWSACGSAQDQADLELIRKHGWYNEGNNLTSLRNRVADRDSEDTLVTILAGYDHIDDRASLMDFFHLDDRSVWASCLGRSFSPWVAARFHNVLDPADDTAAIESIADVLKTVRGHGLADLPAISTYLEGLDLTGVTSGGEAYRLVLGNLGAFGLPPMVELARARGRRSLADYVGPAQEFANYSAFLDASARDKALKALHSFIASEPAEPDEGVLGESRSLEALAGALEQYIRDRSDADRERLLSADFVYIRDKVLGHKTKRDGPPRRTIQRLRGSPPEVFLRALWLTLAEYSMNAKQRLVVPNEDLLGIKMRSVLFKHDFDAGAESTAGDQADSDLAEQFLRRVLGGIDELLERHVELDSATENAIEFGCGLCPGERNTEILYKKTHVAEPGLQFRVELSCGDSEPFQREFLWCLPQNHPSRLLVDLYGWAGEGFRHGGNGVPAYPLPYVPTIFMARDAEEVNRLVSVAARAQQRGWIDLLSASDIEVKDPGLAPLRELSACYQAFLRGFEEFGFFATLDKRYDELRKAYVAACNVLIEQSGQSSLQPLLLKAFFLVDERKAAEEQWMWDTHLECAIATPLHPAVLDMLRHQHAFLCESFCVYASEALRESGGRRLTERAWNNIMDLARIERPIFGILRDSALTLDSGVRSYGYTHLVGRCKMTETQTSSRLLLQYEDDEDEDITDARLFQETRASALVCRTLLDYRKLCAHADDGLSVGAYCGREIQPIIAGIDAFLETILPSRGDHPYWLRITVFSTGRDESAVLRWLDAWRDRWQEAELTSGKAYYGNCRISIAYRVVAEERNREQFARLLEETTQDVMLFSDFSEAGASRFEEVLPEELPDFSPVSDPGEGLLRGHKWRQKQTTRACA